MTRKNLTVQLTLPYGAWVLCFFLLSVRTGVSAEQPLSLEDKTFSVFLLAGQSNMEGQGVVDLDHPKYYNSGKGILKNVMKNPKMAARYRHIIDRSGNFLTRDDVFVRFVTRSGTKAGKLTIGFTGYEGKHHIGPEFQLGHVIGDQIEEPVLLVKTAWGGKSLFQDFRPPSAHGITGEYYSKMIQEIRDALSSYPEEFPELRNRQPVIRGFVWFQGWNDMFNAEALKEYESNLVLLIQDIREEFKSPQLPVVIGELGNGGKDASQNMKSIRRAQKNAALNHGLKNVRFVETTPFARPAKESPNVGHGHHWFGNAESYFLVGDALGQALGKLLK
ncbi:MAG: sialate O-acetylesterase [Planctomycetota bacterium]|nr:sialate O-acetylesterase [Planctomycetota bacterium]